MTKKELIDRLNQIALRDGYDTEAEHEAADDLLIEFINDVDIQVAYDSINKWYA